MSTYRTYPRQPEESTNPDKRKNTTKQPLTTYYYIGTSIIVQLLLHAFISIVDTHFGTFIFRFWHSPKKQICFKNATSSVRLTIRWWDGVWIVSFSLKIAWRVCYSCDSWMLLTASVAKYRAVSRERLSIVPANFNSSEYAFGEFFCALLKVSTACNTYVFDFESALCIQYDWTYIHLFRK